MLMSPEELLRIERAAVKAWPALETAAVAGWLWRHSGGGSQRANSVAALAFDSSDPEAAIDEIEELYRRRGASPRFQVTGVSAPSDLERRLAARNYRVTDACNTLAKAIDPSAALPATVETAVNPTAEWTAVYLGVQSEDRQRINPQILARVPGCCVFCAARHDGRVISTGLGVADGPILIAECIATRVDARRFGGAAAVMGALEGWGATQGATTVALGVVRSNAPAQALYRHLGYHLAGAYHIRVKD